MAAAPLTKAEEEFGQKLASLIEGMSTIQEEARALRETGGDCKAAFLSAVPETERAQVEAQWPYIQMMLGV